MRRGPVGSKAGDMENYAIGAALLTGKWQVIHAHVTSP